MKKIILFVFLFCQLLLAETLEVWAMPNGASPLKVMTALLDDFKKETGIDYNLKILDWGEAWGRIHEALEQKQGPHVVQMGTTWVPYFASRGWLSKLSEKGDSSLSRFNEASLNTCTFDTSNDIFAFPWFLDLRFMMGNKGYLDSLDIKAEDLKDWKSYRQVLQKIKESDLMSGENKLDAFGFPGKSDWNIPHNFAPWIWSEGGSYIKKTEKGWESNLLFPNTVRGIRRYIGLVLDSLASRSTLNLNTASVSQRFNNGEQAFIVGTSEVLQQCRIDADKGGLKNHVIGKMGIVGFPIPSGSDGSIGFLGGSHLAIPTKYKDNESAKRLLDFMLRPDKVDFFSRNIGFLPSDKNVLKTWSKDSIYTPLIATLVNSRTYPNHPEWGAIESVLTEMFSSVWTLVDVEGYYSDDELYEVLIRYNSIINRLVGNSETKKVPSLEEFKSYLDKPFLKTKVNNVEKVNSISVYLLIGTIVFVLMIIFALKRNRSRIG